MGIMYSTYSISYGLFQKVVVDMLLGTFHLNYILLIHSTKYGRNIENLIALTSILFQVLSLVHIKTATK